jgi:L-fucose isomerase-like protein
MKNMPTVKLGVVGVSRDCFPIDLCRRRLGKLMAALKAQSVRAQRCSVIIETEAHALAALAELREKGCNAAVIFLGNFGPEGPTTIFAERFAGPVMACAAAEENRAVLANDRGDALCGMLNLSYNLNLRRLAAHIPQYPVGSPEELAGRIAEFVPIARVVLGLGDLKVFSFGPRPHDFFACNAPLQPLYDLGVELMENSELDLLGIFRRSQDKKREISARARDMSRELGQGNTFDDLLPKLAQYEVALEEFLAQNLGSRHYAVFANKCWPAFEPEFGFVPCFVNSRLASRGIPVACETDIYGAVSEYIVQLASLEPATLLDINNSVPADVFSSGESPDLKGASPRDLFMGFHCGNTASSCIMDGKIAYQVIMHRLMEPGQEPNITRGTLEGRLRPGDTTAFRLQATSDNELVSYIAEGEILDVEPYSFGCIGVFAIPNFARFYRHILIGWHLPHHAAIGFAKAGKALHDAMTLLGLQRIGVPQPAGMLYEGENPFGER